MGFIRNIVLPWSLCAFVRVKLQFTGTPEKWFFRHGLKADFGEK